MGPLSINIPTSTAVTTVPFFRERTYVKFRLGKVPQQDEVEGKGSVIKFEWELVDPTEDQQGHIIKPGDFGSKCFDTVRLYDKNTQAGQVPERSISDLAKRTDALLGTGDPGNKKNRPSRPDFNAELLPALVGQVAFLQFKNGTGEYSGKQDIVSFTNPQDVPGA